MLLPRNSLRLGIAQGLEWRNRKMRVWRNRQYKNKKDFLFYKSKKHHANTVASSKTFFFRLMIQTKIHSVFLFCEMVGTEFRAFLSSTEWFRTKLWSSKCLSLLQNGSEPNSELFYLRRNGSERNSEYFYLLRNGLEPECRTFSDGIVAEWIKISVSSVFRGIFFSRKIAILSEADSAIRIPACCLKKINKILTQFLVQYITDNEQLSTQLRSTKMIWIYISYSPLSVTPNVFLHELLRILHVEFHWGEDWYSVCSLKHKTAYSSYDLSSNFFYILYLCCTE